MKSSRIVLFGVLALVVGLAYVVRQRSVQTGEGYGPAVRRLLAQAARSRSDICEQLRHAAQDGLRAARRREDSLEQDLAAADVGSRE
jgi:hypothetical protein